MSKGFFVTGTDTGVGKTRAAQALVAAAVQGGQRAVGMKPVASGCRATPQGPRSDDAEALIQVSNVDADYTDVNPYALVPAVSPHLAARDAGIDIRAETVQRHFARLAAKADVVIVEGAGGWLAPVSERETMADIARALRLPVVLVVGLRLGCLNHASLTQAAIAQSGLVLAGWIGSSIDPDMERREDNLEALERRLHAPCWAVLPHSPTTSTAALNRLRERVISE